MSRYLIIPDPITPDSLRWLDRNLRQGDSHADAMGSFVRLERDGRYSIVGSGRYRVVDLDEAPVYEVDRHTTTTFKKV